MKSINFKQLRIDDELCITTTRDVTLVLSVLKAIISPPDSTRPSRLVVELASTSSHRLAFKIGERGTLTFAALRGHAPDEAQELFAKNSKTTVQKGDGALLEFDDHKTLCFAIEQITVIHKR